MCNKEAPSVEEATKRWAGQVEFVGIAWFGDDVSFEGFIDKHGLTFPQVNDDPGEVYARFGVAAQPALAIISPSGEVQQIFGAVDEATLDGILARSGDAGRTALRRVSSRVTTLGERRAGARAIRRSGGNVGGGCLRGGRSARRCAVM